MQRSGWTRRRFGYTHLLRLVGGSLAIPAAASALFAQPPLRRLPAAEATFAEPFTAISGLRELRDGRVLVADSREKTLQLVDLARGLSQPVSRSGAGPGEWSTPARLHAHVGDSTVMVDAGNNRFLLIAPDGRSTTSAPIPPNLSMFQHELIGVDTTGNMLFVAARRPREMTDGTVGAADVLRHDRRRSRVDTIGVLAQPRGEVTAARTLPGGRVQMSTNRPLAAQDLCAIAPDGRVAIVRASPYRVEWTARDGSRTVGPDTPVRAIRISADEREAFMRSQVRPGAILVMGPRGSTTPPQRAPAGSPATKRARTPKLSPSDVESMFNPNMTWPAVKPPFTAGAVEIAPDGRVWVLRTRAHDDSIPTYDVFDSSGRLVDRVALSPQTRLVGFGRSALYLARSDEDDLLWLERVPTGREVSQRRVTG